MSRQAAGRARSLRMNLAHLAAFLVSAACIAGLVLALGRAQTEGTSPILRVGQLPAVGVGAEEIPWGMMLWGLETHVSGGGATLRELWYGPPTGASGTLKTAQCTAEVRIVVLESAADATRMAEQVVGDVATPPAEAPEGDPYRRFSDRAWRGSSHNSGSAVFVRGNALAQVYLSKKDSFTPETFDGFVEAVAARLSRAVSGPFEPPDALPVSAQDWGLDLEGAWRTKQERERLFGDNTVLVAVQGPNGIPRAVPAEAISGGDYLVPLVTLNCLLAPDRATITTEGTETRVQIGEAEVVLPHGQQYAVRNGVSMPMAHAAEQVNGITVVPLSFVQSVLGWTISWEQRPDMPLARIEIPQ